MDRADQITRVLDGLADGKSLRAVCREPDMPAASTIILWASQDDAFAEQYARAREAGDAAMAEDIQDIADDDEIKPDDKRVRIDARKWLLAKRQPKKYGDKLAVGGADDLPAIKNEAVGLADVIAKLSAATGADAETAMRALASQDVKPAVH